MGAIPTPCPGLPKRGGHGIPIHGGGKGRPGAGAVGSDVAAPVSAGWAAAVIRER